MISEGLQGVILGGFIAIFSQFLIIKYYGQESTRNLENAIISDVESVETLLRDFSKLHPNPDFVPNVLSIPQPFYTENGIFYNIQGDIQKLKEKNAAIVYKFYINLMIAESERKLIRDQLIQINENPLLITEDITLASTKRMVASVNTASDLIDDIKNFRGKRN